MPIFNIADPHALEDVVAKWVMTTTAWAWVDWVVWWWVEDWETKLTFEVACEGPRGQSVGWYAAAEGDDGVRCLRGHKDWEEVEVLGIVVVDRGSGGKNVIFSNSPNSIFEYSNLL